MVDIKDRLGKLGFKPASSIQLSSKSQVIKIEDVVDGERISTNQGEIILIKHNHPYGSLYGDSIICPPMDNYELNKFSFIDNKEDISPNIIFIDTETTGLNGGTGTIPFLIGYGYFDQEGFTTKQFFLENPIDEMAQLLEFSQELKNFGTTVTFNGKSFDLPLIKARFILNKMENPLVTLSHIDLLHISRRIWKKRLSDRSLKELEIRIINFSRSQDDVPGWLIPQIYFDFLRSGDGSQIKNVIYHNQIDIVSMAIIYQKIQSMLISITGIETIDPLDVYSIAKMYFQIGDYERSINLFNKCLSNNTISQELKYEIHMLVAGIYKKTGQYENALAHWKICAEARSAEACLEIAKYYEHKVDQVNKAIHYTNTALELVKNNRLPHFEEIRAINSINKRINRLNRRYTHVQEKS